MPWVTDPPTGVFTCALHSCLSRIPYTPVSWIMNDAVHVQCHALVTQTAPSMSSDHNALDVPWSGIQSLLESRNELGAALQMEDCYLQKRHRFAPNL